MILSLLVLMLCTGCSRNPDSADGSLSGSSAGTEWSGSSSDSVDCSEETESGTSVQDISEMDEEQMEGQDAFVCEYTNLADETVCKKVDQLLKDVGISEERRDVFFRHVEQFNSSVDSSLLKGSFEKADILSPGYDPYDLQEQWLESNPDFTGYERHVQRTTSGNSSCKRIWTCENHVSDDYFAGRVKRCQSTRRRMQAGIVDRRNQLR